MENHGALDNGGDKELVGKFMGKHQRRVGFFFFNFLILHRGWHTGQVLA
jgi:hypothetical protein